MAQVLIFDKAGKAREIKYKENKTTQNEALVWTHLYSSEEKAVDYVLDELGQDDDFEEDILEDQRPRLSQERSYDIVVLSSLIRNIVGKSDSDDAVLQLSFVIFRNKVITVADMKAPIFDKIVSKLLHKGLDDPAPSQLFTFLVSEMIENSIDAMEIVEKRINSIQSSFIKGKHIEDMLSESEIIKDVMFSSNKLMRANLEVFWEILAGKARNIEAEQFSEHIEDRILYLIDIIDGARESLQNSHNLYMTALSNSMNRHIYKLTVIGAFFLIPTMIASFWGMNVPLPLNNFWSVVGIALVFSLILYYWTRSKQMK